MKKIRTNLKFRKKIETVSCIYFSYKCFVIKLGGKWSGRKTSLNTERWSIVIGYICDILRIIDITKHLVTHANIFRLSVRFTNVCMYRIVLVSKVLLCSKFIFWTNFKLCFSNTRVQPWFVLRVFSSSIFYDSAMSVWSAWAIIC